MTSYVAAAATLAALGVSSPRTIAPPLTITQAPHTAGPLDLAAATLAQRGSELRLKIVTRGDWAPSDLVGKRRLCVILSRKSACIASAGGGAVALRLGRRHVSVAAQRSDARSITLTLDPASVGLASGRFEWQISSSWTGGAGCTTTPCRDKLPLSAPALYRLAAVAPLGCVHRGPALVHNGPRNHKVIALSFDDGPWPDTPRFVSVLEREHIAATFFLIGGQVPGHARLLRRELLDGDVLGNHTYTHPFLTRSGDASSQLARTSAAIEHTAGYRPCVFRPPYGDVNASVVNAARTQRLSTIIWDVDPSDYTRPGTAAIVARVLAGVRNGSIVLMHDGGGPREQTLAALPQIIHALRARGYAFATVPQLLGYTSITPHFG